MSEWVNSVNGWLAGRRREGVGGKERGGVEGKGWIGGDGMREGMRRGGREWRRGRGMRLGRDEEGWEGKGMRKGMWGKRGGANAERMRRGVSERRRILAWIIWLFSRLTFKSLI